MPSGVYERKPFTLEHRANLSVALAGRQRANVGYPGAHLRARKALADQPCDSADETCSGRLEVALKKDTPKDFVKVDPRRDCLYSMRAEDYLRLCVSHHHRYDRKDS